MDITLSHFVAYAYAPLPSAPPPSAPFLRRVLRSGATESLAAALFADTAPTCDAGCTIVDVSGLTGIEGDATNGKACSGVALKRGTTCDVKLTTGYAGTGTTSHSCNAAGTLTAATLATTGCATNYKQTTAALKTPVTATGAAVTGSDQGACTAW